MDEPRPPSPRRPLRRLLLGCLGLVGLLTLLLLGGYGYYRYRLNQDLEAAIAEAIATDPVLTIEELVAALQQVPADENSAPRIIAAAETLPALPELAGWRLTQRPNQRLNDEELKTLTSIVQKGAAALDRVRGLEDLPRGRHAVSWQRDHVSTNTAHATKTRTVTQLLVAQAVALAEDDRSDEALISCRAALNAGRSLRDDPGLIWSLIRMSVHGHVMLGLERILGQQVPTEDALAMLQRVLEEEEREPILLTASRAERAGIHRICQLVASGELSLPQLVDGSSSLTDELIGRHLIRQAHPYCLRYLTGLMRLADRPAHELKPRMLQLQATLGEPPVIARMFVTAMDKFFNVYLDNLARLRCTRTGLAAERFRLRQARWPNTLAELKPDFIDDVPLDPFDGQPLRFRQTEDGVTIYSIGRDGVDDAGKIGRPDAGADIGFQLWHPEQRGLKLE